jgi:anti-anti-sigma factor
VNLTVLSRPAATIAMLEGDLDIATSQALRGGLLNVLGPAAARLLIIDLSGVTFCDVAALAMLIGVQRRARWLGITVCLAAPRPQAAKLLRVTGLDQSFSVCATLDDALLAHAGRPPGGLDMPRTVHGPPSGVVFRQELGN